MDPRIVKIANEILGIEGGLVDDPTDRGGITNHGISLRFAKSIKLDLDNDGDTDADDIRRVDEEKARELFFKHFYHINNIDRLPEDIQPQVFDMSVNHGPGGAAIIVQRVINKAGLGPIQVDGAIGPTTLRKIYQLHAAFQEQAMDLNDAVAAERELTYREIVANDPSQKKYINGWVDRARRWMSPAGRKLAS